ncbi:hypothetical protein B0T11DRAFT_19856 [Plectosphaerella cucumerina]|uniref:Uncharacterized protein n=1 Tax=Plectosphaerella cucumerina TaxID=40658 RepID=A0A8K0TPZ9_9PEZI|nr:hypothetical protein B0T11DRAFT_19856 [Plectosphaerella cucumerina]
MEPYLLVLQGLGHAQAPPHTLTANWAGGTPDRLGKSGDISSLENHPALIFAPPPRPPPLLVAPPKSSSEAKANTTSMSFGLSLFRPNVLGPKTWPRPPNKRPRFLTSTYRCASSRLARVTFGSVGMPNSLPRTRISWIWGRPPGLRAQPQPHIMRGRLRENTYLQSDGMPSVPLLLFGVRRPPTSSVVGWSSWPRTTCQRCRSCSACSLCCRVGSWRHHAIHRMLASYHLLFGVCIPRNLPAFIRSAALDLSTPHRSMFRQTWSASAVREIAEQC